MADQPDAIDQAITATEQTVRVVPVGLNLAPTGRPAQLLVPSDLSPEEALSIVGAIPNIYQQLAAARRASQLVVTPGLVLPREMRP